MKKLVVIIGMIAALVARYSITVVRSVKYSVMSVM